MSHTPTPYRYEVYDFGLVKRARLIEKETGDVFADGIFVDDAAYIVEACNAYEKLKKERDDLLTVAYRAERKISECSDDLLADDWKDIRDHAREAIALCEGGKE